MSMNQSSAKLMTNTLMNHLKFYLILYYLERNTCLTHLMEVESSICNPPSISIYMHVCLSIF